MTPDILAEVAEQAEMIAAQPDADSWFDLLEASVTHISEEMNDDEPTDAKVRDELVQTAGVAIAFIRAIDGKEKPTEHRYCRVEMAKELPKRLMITAELLRGKGLGSAYIACKEAAATLRKLSGEVVGEYRGGRAETVEIARAANDAKRL